MRKRTRARELALQVVYQLDLRGDEIRGDFDELLNATSDDQDVVTFARELIDGCWEKRAEIDSKIEGVAKNWELKRMAALDRNILRLATYELLFRDEIPPLVTINEAIDIAKKFSTRKSGHFVNGILDQIRMNCAPEAKRKKGGPPPPPEEPVEDIPLQPT